MRHFDNWLCNGKYQRMVKAFCLFPCKTQRGMVWRRRPLTPLAGDADVIVSQFSVDSSVMYARNVGEALSSD
jgi:hypothetical protein